MDHSTEAVRLFHAGANCAQATLVAFCDQTGLEPEFAARLASSFGGGMGRQREVCGSVSGMLMVAGLLYGYADPGENDEAKTAHYRLVQELCGRFRQETGTLICRELLGDPESSPVPSPRTAEYYARRPCADFIALAARILDDYIAEHPVRP